MFNIHWVIESSKVSWVSCRLCIVFLTFSCIGYAMPFILCATICCCLPCIISVLGFREDLSQTRGATTESINALPTYKFKLKRNGTNDDQEINSAGEGGLLAAGTEKERAISEEDAVSRLPSGFFFFPFSYKCHLNSWSLKLFKAWLNLEYWIPQQLSVSVQEILANSN